MQGLHLLGYTLRRLLEFLDAVAQPFYQFLQVLCAKQVQYSALEGLAPFALFQIGLSFVVVAFERSRSSAVKASMVRVKLMLVWLLPTLGLAASGQYVFEPVSGFPACFSGASFSAAGHGRRSRMPDVRSFEQLARLQNRRMGTQSGPSGFPVTILGSVPLLFTLRQACLSAVSSEAALGLAKCWQFHWRTALEPRAPSSVS
jgi:hypothetical protein